MWHALVDSIGTTSKTRRSKRLVKSAWRLEINCADSDVFHFTVLTDGVLLSESRVYLIDWSARVSLAETISVGCDGYGFKLVLLNV